MTLRRRIELETQDTIGYSEAKSKDSFMVGVNVAFYKAEEHYEKEIEKLKAELDGYKSGYEEATGHLKNLASIVNLYSVNN